MQNDLSMPFPATAPQQPFTFQPTPLGKFQGFQFYKVVDDPSSFNDLQLGEWQLLEIIYVDEFATKVKDDSYNGHTKLPPEQYKVIRVAKYLMGMTSVSAFAELNKNATKLASDLTNARNQVVELTTENLKLITSRDACRQTAGDYAKKIDELLATCKGLEEQLAGKRRDLAPVGVLVDIPEPDIPTRDKAARELAEAIVSKFVAP